MWTILWLPKKTTKPWVPLPCSSPPIKANAWKTAKSCIFEKYGTSVSFAASSDMYVGAYSFGTKSDKMTFVGNVLKKHPNLETISTTYSCAILENATFRKNRLRLNEHSHQTKKPKPEKIKKSDVALFFIKNNIKEELPLMVATTEDRDLGHHSLYDFSIVFRRQASQEPIEDAW